MKLEETSLNKKIINVLNNHKIFELYPPQKEALPHVLKGKNMVLSIPTASGKSLIAYIGIVNKCKIVVIKALYTIIYCEIGYRTRIIVYNYGISEWAYSGIIHIHPIYSA